jgi:hypothetical protein
LTVEEYQRLRGLEGQIAELQKTRQAEIDAKESGRIKALAEKGEIEKALNEQRKSWEQRHAEASAKYVQLEQQVFSERKSATLAEALSGRNYAGETPEAKAATASMVRRLLDDDFETTRDASGSLVVRQKGTGLPAADVLRARLDSPEFSIFFAPSTRGGSGSQGATNPNPGAGGANPGSLESIAADYRRRMGGMQSFGLAPKN